MRKYNMFFFFLFIYLNIILCIAKKFTNIILPTGYYRLWNTFLAYPAINRTLTWITCILHF